LIGWLVGWLVVGCLVACLFGWWVAQISPPATCNWLVGWLVGLIVLVRLALSSLNHLHGGLAQLIALRANART
jgi:uncharacterized membrane protein YfcA